MPYLSWDAWKDAVFQEMLNNYGSIFGATDAESQITRGEIDWDQWRGWYDAGLTPVEAIDKSLVTD
jgi:hypothetical protein